MNKKEYLKPNSRSVFINAKSTILAGSPGNEVGEGSEEEGLGAKRNFGWEEDED